MSEVEEDRLYGLMEIAERQQAAVGAALEGLAAERGKRKRSPTFRRGSELSILPVVVDKAMHDGRERGLL